MLLPSGHFASQLVEEVFEERSHGSASAALPASPRHHSDDGFAARFELDVLPAVDHARDLLLDHSRGLSATKDSPSRGAAMIWLSRWAHARRRRATLGAKR
jgi:hypothetical protein